MCPFGGFEQYYIKKGGSGAKNGVDFTLADLIYLYSINERPKRATLRRNDNG
jgi:hypothetical protein